MKRAEFYQRALIYLPGSYKLWYGFLRESRKYLKNQDLNIVRDISHYDIVNDLYERALVYMNKMPKIWLDYAKFMSK